MPGGGGGVDVRGDLMAQIQSGRALKKAVILEDLEDAPAPDARLASRQRAQGLDRVFTRFETPPAQAEVA